MSRPFLFLASVALQLCILATAYYFAVASRIPDNELPNLYHDFLLERIAGPKIIVDSGSNAHTGISSGMLEEAFGLPALNVADNAGYPLFFKVVRLERVTNPGDVVILPLEWNHYTADRPSDVFVDHLFGPTNRYFWHLEPLERVKTVFSIPARKAIHQFRNPSVLINLGLDDMRDQLRAYLQRARSKGAGGGAILQDNVPLAEVTEALTCDGYLFFRYSPIPNFTISRYFLDALDRLKKLQDQGVTVVFTWPSVVDEDCYTSDSGITDFLREVELTIVESGLPVLAKPEDSRFPRRLIHDTYYHLNSEGRAIRTKQLIDDLRSADLIRANPNGVPVREQLEDMIPKELWRLEGLIRDNIQVWSGQRLKIGAASTGRYLYFENGWHNREKWGRWSDGHQSVLWFRLSAKSNGATLRVWGTYFESPEDTEVLVNDRSIGLFRFDPEEYSDIPVSAEDLQASGGTITVTFKHQNPVSPRMLGQSEDPRKLKFGLREVEMVWN